MTNTQTPQPSTRQKRTNSLFTMTDKKQIKTLHPKNLHNQGYDFDALCISEPELKKFVSKNPYGNLSVDFADPDAVFTLNKALLSHFYGIKHYSLPKGYLCPPIPGRADYIHHIADILKKHKEDIGEDIHILDIGSGANCIYPVLGVTSYGWNFTASDIDKTSIENINKLVKQNDILKDKITAVLQPNIHDIFNGIIKENDYYHFTMCNPPFHSSKEDALKGSKRKVKNLKGVDTKEPLLNFAGQANELWCKGGELAFLKKMIKQSVDYKENVMYFSTLVSKQENLKTIYKLLKRFNANHKTIEMKQGNKTTRIVVWSFKDQNLS